MEGDNIPALLHFSANNKTLEEVPAMLPFSGFLIHTCFNTDEGIGNDAIGFLPGSQNFIRSRLSKHLLDRLQQKFAYDRIVLGLDAKTYVLMPDLDDGRDNRFQIINMNRCRVYGIGDAVC
ncbi:hypothetical protein D3C71_1635900 [compost metagenome]